MLGKTPSIRTLLTALVAVLVLPLLGLVVFFSHRAARAEIRSAEEGLWATAGAVALATQQFLDDAERTLTSVADHPAVRSLDPSRCEELAPELAEFFVPPFTNLGIWSREDGEVCSVISRAEGEADPDWLPEAFQAEGLWVGPVHKGLRSGRWATGLTYPVRGAGGAADGMVAVGLDLLHFQAILARLETREDGIVTIAQPDMVVVARSGGGEEWVGSILAEPGSGVARETSTARGVSRGRTVEGEDYLFGSVPIPNAPWTVYAGIPAESVYGPIRERTRSSALWTLGILLAVSLVGVYTYRRIADPLGAMVAAAAGAVPGDPSPLPAWGPHEIALVARRFNEAWRAWGESEQERKRSDERIRSLVENAITGIYVSTAGGRFLEVNQALVEILGYGSREELLNTPLSALYSSEEERASVIREHGDRSHPGGFHARWRRKDGAVVTVRLFARAVVHPGEERAWEVIVEDVTERMRLQEQYLQAQKMEALGRMAGGIAHDFNNLLTVVQGEADMMQEDPRLPEDLRRQAQAVCEAALRGAALNRQLLAFGRRSSTQRRNLDLVQVLQGIEIMLRRVAGEEIRLRLHTTPELDGIMADRGQVEQVIMNLVVNARDSMLRGGDLTIEVFNTVVSVEDLGLFPEATPGPHVVVSVSDTGTGIAADILPHIFEPFFTTKPESKGTGLGLSTVYGIVADSGGHIRVESEPGKGSTFSAFFPAIPPDGAAAGEPAAAALRHVGAGVVLLVEDEDAVRHLATRILERAGYEVLQARSGTDALELARRLDKPVRLLVTDVVMPGLRGPDLAETLAGEGRVRRVLLFSGYPDGMPERGPRGLEAWELIPKPFTVSELLAAMERVLKA